LDTEWQTSSPEGTAALGRLLGRSLVERLAIALVGPLGAGKTEMVKGIACGNGAPDARKVTSPTFTLIHEYAGRLTLFHIDAYRLRGPTELLALGFDELIGPGRAAVIEWADRVAAAMPRDCLRIEIEPTGETDRRFRMTAEGEAAAACLEACVAARGRENV
jgi:tRNA threonylcarbamoyladenosine biosynthesis protein TsaE